MSPTSAKHRFIGTQHRRLLNRLVKKHGDSSMKFQRLFTTAALVTIFLSSTAYSQGPGTSSSTVTPFLGRWDLTLKAPDHEYPSWLEVTQDNGQLKARMVGRWGNARPLPKVEIANGTLTFVSPKEEESSKDDMVFHGKLVGKSLSGTVNGPDGTPWQWTGERAPTLVRTSAPKWGKPVQLFNGKDLTGWKMSKPGPPEWTVHDGTLVSPGNGPELV